MYYEVKHKKALYDEYFNDINDNIPIPPFKILLNKMRSLITRRNKAINSIEEINNYKTMIDQITKNPHRNKLNFKSNLEKTYKQHVYNNQLIKSLWKYSNNFPSLN